MANSILIIDDDKSNLKLLSRFLNKRGFKTLTASTAEEGYTLIASDNLPDIILLDLKLPGMDGLELATLLKRNKSTRNIIIIAVTAYENSYDENTALHAGCNDYIVKPINMFSLSKKIKSYINVKKYFS